MATITGLITVNQKDVLEVDANPAAGGGTAANMGSLAMYDSGVTGSLYLKTGSLDTDWTALYPESDPYWALDGNTVGSIKTIGTIDNFDQPFIRNNIEVMRTVGVSAAVSGLLIGLNASLGGRLQLTPNAAGDDLLKEILSPTSNPTINVSRMFRATTIGALTSTFNIAIPSAYNALLEARVVANQTGGATGAVGDGGSYVRTCHASNVAGTVTMFKQQTDYTYEIAGGMDFALSAAGANIVGTVTGSAGRNLSWGSRVELLMITT